MYKEDKIKISQMKKESYWTEKQLEKKNPALKLSQVPLVYAAHRLLSNVRRLTLVWAHCRQAAQRRRPLPASYAR
jgi:hypothetical protein